MYLNQGQNANYYQQANMGQHYGNFQQVSMCPNGYCCQQINIGPNCCQQITMNSTGSSCQQISMNGNFYMTNFSNTNNINYNIANTTGKIVREKRNLPLFEGIHVNGSLQIFLTQNDEESVTVEADENIIRNIETKVQNRILYVSNNSSFNMGNQIIVYISMKIIQQIGVYGSSSLIGQSEINMNDLKIDVNGSSNLNLQINVQKLCIHSSGASNVVLAGTAKIISASVTSSSNLVASGLIADDYEISIKGSSSANINAKNFLGYDVSGASSLFYGSNPNIRRAICKSASSVNHSFSYI